MCSENISGRQCNCRGEGKWPPSQTPDLNPSEITQTALNVWVYAMKPTNLSKLCQFCQEEWSNIRTEFYQKFVDGYQKHLVKVKAAKGHLTK